MIRDPKKKCIAKKCEDCHFYQQWHMENNNGEKRFELKCSFTVLFEEIPRIRGSIDGCQSASNEARNRAVETKNQVIDFSTKAVKTIKTIAGMKLLEDRRK